MKKVIVIISILSLLIAVPAFADREGGRGQQGGAYSGSQSGAMAGANASNYFEGTRIAPGLTEGPMLMGPQIQQNNAPTGRDKHFNRTIKPWAIKKCWTMKDLDRIENQFGFGNSIVKGKGNVQIIPFEDMKGSVNAFTVLDPMKYEDAIKVYTVIAAGVVFASDSENTYMQQWVKVMKANLKEVGTAYVMIYDEGGKEGSEAFGWNFGISVGASLAGVNGAGDRTTGVGATIGAGVANSQTVSQEYPHLTIIMLDAKAPAKK
jgi:hypothetical protein